MTKEQTYTLYVNLSASQTRKRLKGHGLGVKQVEAADRNQAAITHTATGSHFQDLLALFDGIASSTTKSELDALADDRRDIGAEKRPAAQ